MDGIQTSQAQRPRTADRAVRGLLPCLLALLALGLLLLTFAPTASADLSVCTPGAAAGQCEEPQGVAVDNETGRLYVADKDNNRVDVFESDGAFVMAFGWGVDSGAKELQSCTTASKCQPAVAGSGAGQFNGPTWIAVDNDPSSPSRHSVYVGTDNFRVQKFTSTGEFIEALGEKGKGPCQLERESDPIAVGPEGKLYVADSYEAGALSNFVNRVVVFDAAGKCLGGEEVDPLFEGPSATIRSLAVDSGANFYVTVAGAGGVIRKFDPSGTLLYELGEGGEAEGIAVDAADRLFAKQNVQQKTKSALVSFITEYDSSGSILKRFNYGALRAVPGLAAHQSATGDLYASRQATGVEYLSLPSGPALVPEPCKVKPATLGNTKATLQAEVNPEGKATSFHFEYVDEESFEKEGGFASPNTKKTAESESIGSDFELHEASALANDGVVPETTYRCRIVATNADGSTTGEEGSFTTLEPLEIGDTTVSAVGTEEATLNATVNPLGIPTTTAYFEYVTEATYLKDIAELGPEHGFDHASKAPNLDAEEKPIDYGAGESFKAGSAHLTGLKPGTSYRFHIVATDARIAPKEVVGETTSFRTYGAETEALADDRAWELVSPGQKNSAEVAVPGTAAGFFEIRTLRIQAGAGSGEAVTYTSWTSFGEAEGSPATNQYLSRRGGGGWETENISPFGFLRNALTPPFTGFGPDLRFGAMLTSEPPLAPGCPEEYDNLYLRDNESGALSCLSPEAPNSTPEYGNCFTFAGASADGQRAFFSAVVPYAGAPTGGGASLYEWSASEGLRVASILPGESAPVPPSRDTSFGAADGNCQTGLSTMRHVVSADGSRAIWTYTPTVTVTAGAPGTQTVAVGGTAAGSFHLTFKEKNTAPLASNANAASVQKALEALTTIGSGNAEVTGTDPYTITLKGSLAGVTTLLSGAAASDLLVRVNGTETKQLDEKISGAGVGGDGVFWTASTDGSVVYFTDENRLIAGSKSEKGKPDLYRYEFGSPAPLSNLTKGSVAGDVRGVVGASDDGSYVYFTAGAVLSGEEENGAGQKAAAGKENLYLHHAGVTTFIATLDPRDEYVRSEQPRNLSARVSPDGRHLAFLSFAARALAGYDPTVADGGVVGEPPVHCEWDPVADKFIGDPTCAQAFVYDADTGALRCASCNPSAARPLGPTLLPGWTNVYEGPRLLSDDGSRVFFETYDQLLPADENLKRDVYGFELPGAGSCSAQSPNFDPASGGCHFLVSSGKDSDESYLVDASGDGRDVFFSTRAQLTGWDTNENFDIYDAREGGGFPEPPPAPPICVGEGCKAPASTPPATPSPATPHIQGPENARERCPKGKARRKGRCERPHPRCPKGKVSRKARCVKTGQNRKAQQQKRASHKRRTAR